MVRVRVSVWRCDNEAAACGWPEAWTCLANDVEVGEHAVVAVDEVHASLPRILREVLAPDLSGTCNGCASV